MIHKDVFILGAGFSRAISNSMPIMNDLTKAVSENSCIDLPPPLRDVENQSQREIKEDVELWLTYLYHRQPWLQDDFNNSNRKAAKRIVKYIAELIEEGTIATAQSPVPDWLVTLVHQWHQQKASVITLNYDTLVERIAKGIGIELAQLYDSSHPTNTFKYLKIHGSINWQSSREDCDAEGWTYYDVTPWTSSISASESSLNISTMEEPLIIPPLVEKAAYYDDAAIRNLWLRASDAIDSATRVFVIGYSLPISDLGMQLFLMRSLLDEPTPWYLVNTDTNIKCHFKRLLPRYEFLDNFISDQNPVKTFAESYPELPML